MHIPYAYVEGLRVNCSVSIKLQEKSRTQNCRCIYVPYSCRSLLYGALASPKILSFVGNVLQRHFVGRRWDVLASLSEGYFLAEGYFWLKAIFGRRLFFHRSRDWGPCQGPNIQYAPYIIIFKTTYITSFQVLSKGLKEFKSMILINFQLIILRHYLTF